MCDSHVGVNTETMEEESKREYIKGRLKSDPLAVDFQWSLMVAALASYRHDTVLRPFPPIFQNEHQDNGVQSESRDFRSLVSNKIQHMSQGKPCV